MLAARACEGSRTFFLPNTLDLDGEISSFQRLRYARHAMRLNYRHHRVLRLGEVFAAIGRDAKPGDMITGGHIDFQTCREKLPQNMKMIALIRNPVERSLSEYAYARHGFNRKSPWTKFDASVVAKAAGRYSYDGYLDYLLEHSAVFGNIACRYLGRAPDADIAGHFDKYAFHFGTVDNLDGFAKSLARKTGRNVALQHLNRTLLPTDRIITHATRAKIERLYAADFEVYEWARRRETAAVAEPSKRAAARIAVPV